MNKPVDAALHQFGAGNQLPPLFITFPGGEQNHPMKSLLKTIFYSPFGVHLCRVMRLVYRPPESRAGWMKFKGAFRVKTSEGNSFWLYNSTFILETMIFWLGLERYSWERTTRMVWNRLAENANVILDVGANSGVFSVLAGASNPEAKIVAFEPQPNIYRALQKNVEVNNFNIRCEQLALSNCVGVLPFYNYGDQTFTEINTTAGSLNRDWRSDRQSAIEVEVTRLDRYLVQHNIGAVQLMKIDVETLEHEVLLGYGSLFFEHRPAVILEIQNETIGERIANLLGGKDYLIYQIQEDRGLRDVEIPRGASEDRNYLLLPIERLGEVEGFLV